MIAQPCSLFTFYAGVIAEELEWEMQRLDVEGSERFLDVLFCFVYLFFGFVRLSTVEMDRAALGAASSCEVASGDFITAACATLSQPHRIYR